MADMRLAVIGAAGRMGRMLIKTIAETPGVTLAGALEREGATGLGLDAGTLAGTGVAGVMITADARSAFSSAEGVLDFSSPAASVALSAEAAAAGIVHVVGTTGLSEADLAKLKT